MQVVHVTLMLYIMYGISSRYALAMHLCGLVSLSRAYIGYVLLVLASRLPVVGALVYDNEAEFIEELRVRTGLPEKQVKDALKKAGELGWFERRKVVGQGHVELRPTIPHRIGFGFQVRRVERGEAPRVVYAINELSVDAIQAALKEADEESGQVGSDVEPRGDEGPAARGSDGGGTDVARHMVAEQQSLPGSD
jgi:hypothetical protein